MISLPIDSVLGEVIDGLRATKRVVLQAPPGAGKSTRVPGAVLDAGITDKSIVMLEPRRLAARSLARRIADERDVPLGGVVGYHVRFDRKISKDTRIQVVTEGILTRRLIGDPFLEDIGVVILDEFHERSIHSDLALAFLKEVQEARDDLHIVVMSATLGADPLSEYLDTPIVTSEGRTYPLTIDYVEKPPQSLEEGVAEGVRRLLNDPDDDGGDILVFLPSSGSIRDAADYLKLDDVEVVQLYGAMRAEDQDRVMRPGKRRRVVLSTNIAETSLTIPRVTGVVDSGWVRRVHASKSTGFDELREERISMASATQRAGRAGRTAPGRVVRLWTHAEEHRFPDFDIPEIGRVDLARTALDVVAWSGQSATEFDWFEAPRGDQVERAQALLEQLDLLDETQLTNLGKRCLEMPLHPRLATILARADQFGCGDQAAKICAVVSEQDFVTDVGGKVVPHESDVMARVEMLDAAAQRGQATIPGYRVHQGRARRVQQTAKRLGNFVKTKGGSREDAMKALVTGFADRVCFRRASGFAASGGYSVTLGRESKVESEMFVAATIFGTDRSGNGIVRMASHVQESWLEELFPRGLDEDIEVSWDDGLQKVVARRVKRFLGVRFHEEPASLKGVDDFKIAAILAQKLADTWESAFDKDAKAFIERLVCAASVMAELDFPAPGTDGWTAMLEQVSFGKRSPNAISDGELISTIKANFSPEQRRSFQDDFPERLQVPSGSNIKIDYSDPERPVLAVRIQEVFGMLKTPRIGGGRLPVVMHLLAPNYRPAQITSDLEGFWESSYFDVRKDLRARYPKHDWPEDPKTATARRKTTRRKN